ICEASKFIFIAQLTPTLVVTVLLSSTCIPAGGLQVPVWRGTNPHVIPSRRNRQALDSKNTLLVANSFSFGVKVFEVFAVRFPPIARSIIADVIQTGFLSCLRRISRYGRLGCLSVPTVGQTRPHRGTITSSE